VAIEGVCLDANYCQMFSPMLVDQVPVVHAPLVLH
jgi:hypothetical protein